MSYNTNRHSLSAFRSAVTLDRKLHKAISVGSLETVVDLLENGASVNCYVNGLTPTACAITNGKVEITHKLLEYKPDVHQGRRTFNCSSSEKRVKNQHLPLLILAVQEGFPEIVESLLLQGADVNVTDDLNSQTGLHIGVEAGRMEEIQFLLRHESNVNRLDVNSKAALHLAVEVENCDMAKILINAGATVNLPGYHDQLPLHIAAGLGGVEMVELLMDNGAMVNVKDVDHASPLHYAALNGHLGAVQTLLNHNADILHMDELLEMPLHKAVERGHHQVAEYLLSKGHIDLNKESGQGPRRRLPVQTAVSNGDFAMLEVLLHHGADVNARDSMYGESALHCAVQEADMSMIQFLVEHKADVSLPSLPDGDTPLHMLCMYDKQDMHAGVAKFLIESGANVNNMKPTQGHFRECALHNAVRHGLVNMTQQLLSCPDVNTELLDSNNETPLRVAIRMRNERIQIMLIEQGCNLSQTINNQNDVAYSMNVDAYTAPRLLIAHGAEVVSDKSQDPLYILFQKQPVSRIAESEDLLSLVELLLKAGADVGRASEPSTPMGKSVRSQKESVHQLLQAYASTAQKSLFFLCACSIRAQLRIASGGSSILKRLSQLPLPSVIKEQLHMKCHQG